MKGIGASMLAMALVASTVTASPAFLRGAAAASEQMPGALEPLALAQSASTVAHALAHAALEHAATRNVHGIKGPVDPMNMTIALASYGYTDVGAVSPILRAAFPSISAPVFVQAEAVGYCNTVSAVVLKKQMVNVGFTEAQAESAVGTLGGAATPTSLAVLGSKVFKYKMPAMAAAIRKSYPSVSCDELADALSAGYCANFTAETLEPALVAAGFSASQAHTTGLRYFDPYHVSFVSMAKLLHSVGYTMVASAPALRAQYDRAGYQMAQALSYGFCGEASAANITASLFASGYSGADVAEVCHGGFFG